MKPKKRRKAASKATLVSHPVSATKGEWTNMLPFKSTSVVRRVTKAVAESRKRMNTYTPTERAELEQYGRDVARVAQGMESPLKSPRLMLQTLKLAYQHVLDEIVPPEFAAKRRLTAEQQRDLGRRLATYWTMNEEDL